jgi:hypothetical protein
MIISQRLPALQMYEDAAAEDARVLKPGPGARRMRETQEFYAFLRAEQPELLARWRNHRRALLAEIDTAPAPPSRPGGSPTTAPSGTPGSSSATPW